MMERLTVRAENGKACYAHPTDDPIGWAKNRTGVLEKLAQYEDAELARQSVTDSYDRIENKQMIYANIRRERDIQDAKWGFPQRNSLSEWGNILGEEYGEYCKALNELVFGRTKDPGEMTDELIHVAAVAVGILEHLLIDGGIRE